MLKCQIVKTGNKNTNSPNSNKLFLQYCFIEQIPRRPNSSIVPKKNGNGLLHPFPYHLLSFLDVIRSFIEVFTSHPADILGSKPVFVFQFGPHEILEILVCFALGFFFFRELDFDDLPGTIVEHD